MKKIVLTKLNRHIAGVAYEQWENDEKKEKACVSASSPKKILPWSETSI